MFFKDCLNTGKGGRGERKGGRQKLREVSHTGHLDLNAIYHWTFSVFCACLIWTHIGGLPLSQTIFLSPFLWHMYFLTLSLSLSLSTTHHNRHSFISARIGFLFIFSIFSFLFLFFLTHNFSFSIFSYYH